MPDIKTVKATLEVVTDKAQQNVAKLADKVRELQDSLYRKTHRKESLVGDLSKTKEDIAETTKYIKEMSRWMVRQNAAMREQSSRIATMKKDLANNVVQLHNIYSAWGETGKAIEENKARQSELAKGIQEYKNEIPELTSALENLKSKYKELEAARKESNEASAKVNAYREMRRDEMKDVNEWGRTPATLDQNLKGDSTFKELVEGAEKAKTRVAEVSQEIREMGGETSEVGKARSIYNLSTQLSNTKKALTSATAEFAKAQTEEEKLTAQSNELASAFREIAGEEAQMKGSSIANYAVENANAIDEEEAALENWGNQLRTVRSVNSQLVADREVLRQKENELESELRVVTGEAEEESEALEKSGESSKKASDKHHSFGQAMSRLGKVLKNIKGHISSVAGHFKKFASSIKGAIPHSNKFGGVIGKLANQFKRLFVMRVLRNLITSMIKGFKEGIDNVVKYSAALNGLDANNANRAMSELASTTAYLKNVLGSVAIPVLNAVIPLVRQLATAFATAVNYVNQFLSALSGKSSWTRAKQVTVDYASSLSDVGSSAGGAKDAVEDLKRTIMGFDEINKLNDANSSSGSGGGGSGGGGSDSVNVEDMFEEVPIDNKVKEWLNELKPYIDKIKDAWDRVKTSIKDLVNSEGFKYLISTTFKEVLKTIATLMGSFADTVDAFKDALNDPVIKSKIDDIKLAWDRVLQSIKNLTSSPAWKSVVEAATFIGLTTIEGILNTISGLIDSIKGAIEDLDKNGKIEALKKAWEDVTDAISNLVNSQGFKTLVSTVIDMGVTALSGAFEAISTIINESVIPALDDLKDNGTFKDISDAWAEIWEHIQSIANSKAFKYLVSESVKTTIEAIATAMKLIADALQIIDGILTGDLEKVGTGFAKALIDIFDPIISLIAELYDKVSVILGIDTHFSEDWDTTAQAIRNAVDNGTDYYSEREKILHPVETPGLHESSSGVTHGGGGGSLAQGKTDGSEYKEGYEEGSSGITVPIDSDTKEAVKKYDKFSDEVNGIVMNAPLDAKTTPAKEAYKKYKLEVEKKITSPVDANTSNANTKYTTYKNTAQQTVTSPVNANTTNATTTYNTYKTTAEKTVTSPIEAKITNATTTKSDLEKILGTLALNGSFSKTNKDTIKSSLDTLLSSLGLNGSFSNDNKTSIKADVASYLQTLQLNGYFTADNKYAIRSDLKTYFSDIPMKGYVAEITTPSYVNPLAGGDVTYRPAAGKFTGGIISKEIGGIVQAASGRRFDSAQLFTARENGIPEYVGRFGSHSAVANNYQIVTGIAQGVSAAMVSQNDLLREQNSLLREIASKSGNTSVSSILGAMNRVNKRTGTPVVQMG